MNKQEQISCALDNMPEALGQKLPIGERKYQNRLIIETKCIGT